MSPSDADALRRGTWAAVAAYLLWGLAPIYFKALVGVAAAEVIAHRVAWSVLLLAVVLLVQGRLARALIDVPWKPLAVCALLVTSNWLVYVWAIQQGRVLEASLGYFINPLLSIVLAGWVLGERLGRWQKLAFACAAVGVLNELVRLQNLPWIALYLASTFALYGLIRKQTQVDAVRGLLVETLLAAPIAVGYLTWLAVSGELAFTHGPWMRDALLVAAGAVTAIPLLLFAFGARRLPLVSLGFLQYLAPSLMFLLGVLVYREPFDAGRLTTFACIWFGLALLSWDAFRRYRQRSPLPAA